MFSERGIQLGYLSAERCGWIGGIMARGEEVEAIFQAVGSTTAVIRVAIGGGQPKLPPAAAAATSRPPSEQEWYPDYIPPDEDESWA